MRAKRIGRTVVTLVGIVIALAGMGAWWRAQRRRPGIAAVPQAPRASEALADLAPAAPAPHRGPIPPDPARIVRTADVEHPFGPASAASGPDGAGPDGWAIKANPVSGLYHAPSSPSWRRTRAEAWFETEEAAQAAGFTRWDWRRRAS